MVFNNNKAKNPHIQKRWTTIVSLIKLCFSACSLWCDLSVCSYSPCVFTRFNSEKLLHLLFIEIIIIIFSTFCCCCCYCALCQCFSVCLLYNCWYFSAWNSFLGQINISTILLCISLALLEKKCIPSLLYSLLLIFLGSVYYGNRYFSTKLNNFNKQTVISRWFSAYLFKFNQNN